MRIICSSHLLFATFLFAGSLTAASVTVGTANNINALPFADASNGLSVYQQIYANNAFSGPINIGSLSFLLAPLAGAHDQLFAQPIAITLSTTSTPLGSRMLSPLSSNAVVLGTYGLTQGAAPAVLTFSGSPFHYDPSQGNLLLEIDTPNTLTPINLFTEAYFESDNRGELTSRICSGSECNESQRLGD